jgi:hypothetical protein
VEQELQAPPEAQVLTLTSICCVVLAFEVSCHTQSSVFLAGGNGDTGPTGGTGNVKTYCVDPQPSKQKTRSAEFLFHARSRFAVMPDNLSLCTLQLFTGNLQLAHGRWHRVHWPHRSHWQHWLHLYVLVKFLKSMHVLLSSICCAVLALDISCHTQYLYFLQVVMVTPVAQVASCKYCFLNQRATSRRKHGL